MKIKHFFAVAALTLGFTTTAFAQEAADGLNYKPYPHMFVSVQGGVQTTHTTNYSNAKLLTPTASLGVGAFFTPIVGARLHFNGMWNKGGLEGTPNYEYEYKYVTSDLDLMINLCTLFGKKKYYPVNVYLIGGVGLNTAWDNADAYAKNDQLTLAYNDTRFTHNARVGAQLDWNLCKHLSLNLEVDANSLGDRYNSKYTDCDDWQMTAQLGLAYKFGYKKKAAPVEEEWATRIDTVWYDDIAYTPRVEDGNVSWNVFYSIRESDFTAEEELANIGAFLADHRECKISIKSYADAGTGNPTINAEYARLRSEKAKEALVKAGVDPSIITAESFGDTVQPFAENDKNRVSIITAMGLKDLKDKYTVKKFRTKEVRYRVK